MNCEPVPILRCSDPATIVKRKRLKYCAHLDECCSGCKLKERCRFVCPEIGGKK